MPYSRPALSELIARTRNDMISRLPSVDVLRRNNADVSGRVMAGVAHGVYGFINWLGKQLIYDTADGDILRRWAAIWGIEATAATAAGGLVTFTGTDGAVIAAGTQWAALDGVVYETTSAATIASGVAAVESVAIEPGANGNRAAGEIVILQNAVAGVDSTATAGLMTGGADAESDDALRARLLMRIRQPPQGGAKNDYVQWAMLYPGVTRVWVAANELGAGSVVVRFMMDGSYSDGIPDSGDVNAVRDIIDIKRPVCANVTILAPVPVALDFVIGGLLPSTDAVKSAVSAELAALIKREAVAGGTLLLSHIREAISIAAGENDHALISPAANVNVSAGQVLVMGGVDFV